MTRFSGTVSRGLRAPIIREGDDLVQIVTDTVLGASREEGIRLNDRDIVTVTEAVVARAQGNYASVDQIAADVRQKFPGGEFSLVFPILSRNRFSILLKGIARGAKKIHLQLSFPTDEVGNALVSLDQLDEHGINPWTDVLTEAQYRELFGANPHVFTGVDYVGYFRELIEAEDCQCCIFLANDVRESLKHSPHVLHCDIHSRRRSERLLKAAGAETVYSLDQLLTSSVEGSGYNERYGLLGSNKATEEMVKLFPRQCQDFVDALAAKLQAETGKQIEVMIYGDGAFKDPVGGIWELADPVVSPAYTSGLDGLPNELKLKYLADNDFKELSGEELKEAIKQHIINKEADLKGNMASQGTTPRRLTDLLGSLSDLTSGSGDKGTPIILIQGYFDNYAV